MSTVSKTATCPECDYNEAMFQLTIARQETLFCPRCGFERSINYSGNIETNKTAYGAVRMQLTKSHARIGAIIEPITAKIIDDFQNMLDDGEILEEGSYLTRWDPVNKWGEIIIGSVNLIHF